MAPLLPLSMLENSTNANFCHMKGVQSTLHRGGEGKKAQRTKYSNPCAQGYSTGPASSPGFSKAEWGAWTLKWVLQMSAKHEWGMMGPSAGGECLNNNNY